MCPLLCATQSDKLGDVTTLSDEGVVSNLVQEVKVAQEQAKKEEDKADTAAK